MLQKVLPCALAPWCRIVPDRLFLFRGIPLSSNQDVARVSNRKMVMANAMMDMEESADGGVSIPMGEQGVTTVVNVVFEME